MLNRQTQQKRGKTWLLILVICIPLALLLWPPLYNMYDPTLMGIPFFYWFQVVSLILAALLTGIFYYFRR